jgi:hypothetical protein
MGWVEIMGLAASVAMPLWNIPLIVRIVKRRSSSDISLSWVLGVWVCALLMAPSGFVSNDIVWRTFNYMNIVLFTGVVVVVLKYRKKN